MLFKEIINQKEIKERLIRSAKENRVSHAQLFLGPEGAGALPLALAYAQYLLCTNRLEDDSCGNCSNCIRIKKLEHPDLHFSFPVVLQKDKVEIADDRIAEFRTAVINHPYLSIHHFLSELDEDTKSPVIGTKEAGSIIKKLNYKSYEGQYKILIMWMAETMNPTAANNLLKIIEEPPDHTIFILIAQNAEAILPTILSRTQIVKVNRLADDEIVQALENNYSIANEQAQNIALLAEGNYWSAINLALEMEETAFDMTTFREWMLLCHRKNIPGLMQWADEIAALSREQQRGFIRYALHIFRQCIIGTYTDLELQRVRDEEADFIAKFSQFVHGLNILELTEEFNKSHYFIERNANPKLVFLNLSFKVTALMFPKTA